MSACRVKVVPEDFLAGCTALQTLLIADDVRLKNDEDQTAICGNVRRMSIWPYLATLPQLVIDKPSKYQEILREREVPDDILIKMEEGALMPHELEIVLDAILRDITGFPKIYRSYLNVNFAAFPYLYVELENSHGGCIRASDYHYLGPIPGQRRILEKYVNCHSIMN